MPLPPDQLQECLRAVGKFLLKRMPPPDLRDRLDYRVDINNLECIVSAVRPAFDDKTRRITHPLAKAKWVGTRQVWRLFWMRADLKWHAYEPMPEAKTMKKVMDAIDRDSHCCFFG